MKPVLRKERIYRPSSTDRQANRRSRSFRSSCEIGVVRWHAMPSTAEFSAPCSTGVLTAWVELTAIPLKPRLRCFFARGEFSENFLFFLNIYRNTAPLTNLARRMGRSHTLAAVCDFYSFPKGKKLSSSASSWCYEPLLYDRASSRTPINGRPSDNFKSLLKFPTSSNG